MKQINKLIEDLEKEIDKLQEESFGINVPKEIYKRFDKFSKEYCEELYAHLSDTDENEGQRFRVWIYLSQLKAQLSILNQIKPLIEKAKEDLKTKMAESWAYGKETDTVQDIWNKIDEILGGKDESP